MTIFNHPTPPHPQHQDQHQACRGSWSIHSWDSWRSRWWCNEWLGTLTLSRKPLDTCWTSLHTNLKTMGLAPTEQSLSSLTKYLGSTQILSVRRSTGVYSVHNRRVDWSSTRNFYICSDLSQNFEDFLFTRDVEEVPWNFPARSILCNKQYEIVIIHNKTLSFVWQNENISTTSLKWVPAVGRKIEHFLRK